MTFPEEEAPTGKQHPVRCPQCLGSKICGIAQRAGQHYGKKDGAGLYNLTRCGECNGDGFISAAQLQDWQARKA